MNLPHHPDPLNPQPGDRVPEADGWWQVERVSREGTYVLVHLARVDGRGKPTGAPGRNVDAATWAAMVRRRLTGGSP